MALQRTKIGRELRRTKKPENDTREVVKEDRLLDDRLSTQTTLRVPWSNFARSSLRGPITEQVQ